MSDLRIIADDREDDKRLDKLKTICDGQVIRLDVTQIDVGDYLLVNNNKIVGAIEYKTYGDFVSSIMNGHMDSQLADLEQYENPYLFVVGNYGLWRKKSRGIVAINKRSITGYIIKVACTTKVKIIQFDGELEALESMLRILQRDKDKKPQLILPERHKRNTNPNIDMYLALPNVGEKRALMYIEKFPRFTEFITVCKTDNARSSFKLVYGISVPEDVIECCRKL